MSILTDEDKPFAPNVKIPPLADGQDVVAAYDRVVANRHEHPVTIAAMVDRCAIAADAELEAMLSNPKSQKLLATPGVLREENEEAQAHAERYARLVEIAGHRSEDVTQRRLHPDADNYADALADYVARMEEEMAPEFVWDDGMSDEEMQQHQANIDQGAAEADLCLNRMIASPDLAEVLSNPGHPRHTEARSAWNEAHGLIARRSRDAFGLPSNVPQIGLLDEFRDDDIPRY